MGMAASQARLLSITARIHDVEYQAQSLQHAKVQLATQSDQVYEEYLAALEDKTMALTFADPLSGTQAKVPATFNNLCSRNKLHPASGKDYALMYKNQVVVEDAIYDGYQAFKARGGEETPYAFAMFMLGNNLDGEDLRNAEIAAYDNIKNRTDGDYEGVINLHTKLEELTGGEDIYDTNAVLDDKELKKEYDETYAAYTKALYETCTDYIYAKVTEADPAEEAGMDEKTKGLYDYYVNEFKKIEANGGNCVSISDFNGSDGDAANNSEWLHSMVQSGLISIHTMDEDPETGKYKFDATSLSTDTALSEVDTSTVDSTALKKAEAEYEHKMRQINKKDKQFDLDLSNLEAERSALTTELESVKKVSQDNIDRTFGIFS